MITKSFSSSYSFVYFRRWLCLFSGCLAYGLTKINLQTELGGAHFSKSITYKVPGNKNSIVLTTFNITTLENVLRNAEELDKNALLSDKISRLSESLDKIYKICRMKGRSYFLPYKSANLSLEEIPTELDKSLEQSTFILSQLVNLTTKNFTENFEIEQLLMEIPNLIFPDYIRTFDEVKKYLKFVPYITKYSNDTVHVYVNMFLPSTEVAELHWITYLPIKRNNCIQVLRDKRITNIVFKNHDQQLTIQNPEQCYFIEDLMICEDSNYVEIRDSCVSKVFSSYCNFNYRKECIRVLGKHCTYDNLTGDNFEEFTYLGDNKFYVLMTKPTHYVYTCTPDVQRGTLTFDIHSDHPYSGIIEIENNCSLVTAHTSIFNVAGTNEIRKIDNDSLIRMDIPKIYGLLTGIELLILVFNVVAFALLTTCFCYCRFNRNLDHYIILQT